MHAPSASRRLRPAVLVFALVNALPLASCDDAPAPLPTTCAGHEELCERRFDEVSFAATHNSMADTDHRIFAACQTHDIAQQLEDGVRGFMIDLYPKSSDPEVVLTCHGLCFNSNYPFVDVLEVMTGFLRGHRDAILTIVLENNVPADRIAASVEEAGASRYVMTHRKGDPWPTLREMITANTRLVILTDDEGGTEASPNPWLLDQWQYAFQNPYAAETEEDFSCDVDRGTDAPNSLFVMNHFLTAPAASFELAESVNHYGSLQPHVERCRQERGRIPNLVTVDFYDTGDLFRVVDELNGFAPSP